MGKITKFIAELITGKSYEPFDGTGGYSLEDLFGQKGSIKTFTDRELFQYYRGWIFACADIIGDGMAGTNTALYKDKTKTQKITHPYEDLIDSQLIKAMSIFLKTTGAVYIYKEVVGKRIVGLKMLKSQHVYEIIGGEGKVIHYHYFDGYNTFQFYDKDLIIIKTFTPMLDITGSSPLKAVASQIAMDLSSIEYNRIFFENGGKPGTVLKHAQQIDADVRDKYLANWKKNFGGLKNAHKVAFLDRGIELQDFSQNQKDMDLVNQRMFTMDEILMIFRVPKPLLGKSDGVGFADRKVPSHYFIEFNLKPLSWIIADELNKQLFIGVGYFSFEFPQDKEDLQKEYLSNLITQNQYLVGTGRQPFQNGDRLWDGTEVVIVQEKKQINDILEKHIEESIQKAVDKETFGTDAYNQKSWETKIKRTDVYEKEMSSIQKKIWNMQEKEIISNLKKEKSFKEVKKESDLFNGKASKLLYYTLYSNFFAKMMGKEGKIAMEEISDEIFSIAKLNKWIGENIDRMSTDIDETTRKEIFEIIKQGNREEVGVAQISLMVRNQFNDYSKKNGRVEMITRTEITRASNKSQQEAYVQSGVVESKEWFTASDERVCPNCGPLNGKKVGVEELFFEKGDTAPGGLALDYEDIGFPALHVNCRCTLRPIIKRKKS